MFTQHQISKHCYPNLPTGKDTLTLNMDVIEDNKYQRSYVFLKRIPQLIVSIALCSIFLCYPSGFSWFPRSFNVHFPTFLFSFFTHSLERKYMFLICNGILAILAKSNISSGSSSRVKSAGENYAGERVSISSSSNFIQTKPSLAEEELMAMPEEEEEQEDDINGEAEELESEPLHVEEEEESEVSVVVEDDEGESQSLVKEEEPAEDAAAATAKEDGPSTEELNRKIEAFIRTMKEEIRIEAQQQLITAA